MKIFSLALLLLVVGSASLSLTAQTPSAAVSQAMLDLLEPGQVVGVREIGFGYGIRIYTENEIERAIAAADERREGLREKLQGTRGLKRLDSDSMTSRQRFEAKNPKIGSVHSDCILLTYPDGRERRIATRAIVEITRRQSEENSNDARPQRSTRVPSSESETHGVTPTELKLEGGYVDTGLNEVSIVSTVDDPPGLRLGVMRQEGWGRSLGKFSFNSVRPDRVQDECVLIQGKLDERFPFSDLVGEYIFFLRTPPGGGDEGDMVRVLTLQHDQIVAHVPVVFERGGAPASEPPERP